MAKVEIVADSEELYQIIKATNKENPAQADVDRLKTYLAEHPKDVAKLGNLAIQVEALVVDQAFSTALNKNATYAYMANMRADMGYNSADTIEKSLIDNVVLCWLRLYVAEFYYEQYTKNATLERAMFWEKALSTNQRRYLRAVETLARVRRLMKDPPSPAMAILLKQQLNVSR